MKKVANNIKTSIELSVIVSVYNVKNYINDCLKSLSEQSVRNVEFIVIDDGSTDGSGDICDKWARYDKRFLIIHQENKGLFLAREVGIIKCKGERIVFLDGDDILTREALYDIFKLIEKSNADIIQFSSKPFGCTSLKQFNNISNYLYNRNIKIEKNINIARSIFMNNLINCNLWNKIYKSKILKQSCLGICKYKCICAEDVYRIFLISYFANTLHSYKTRPLYLYRVNTGITTKKQDLDTFKSHILYEKIISDINIFLQNESASNEWYICLRAIKIHLYSSLICIMSNLPKTDFDKAFLLFYNRYNIIACLPWLEKYFIRKQNKLAAIYINLQQCLDFKISEKIYDQKIIGIFYYRYYNGGIERVISLQIPLFIKLGYRVVLFTEEINEKLEYDLPSGVIRVLLPRSYAQNRADIFLSAIKKYNISVFCYHAISSSLLLFDLILLHESGIRIILTAHENIDFVIARNEKYLFDRVLVYRLASILLTLSSSDEFFYQQCGINAHYIPNQLFDIKKSDIDQIEPHKPTVLWCGRLDNTQKNYKEALKIFKIIIKENKNIECYIVGSGGLKDSIYVKLFIILNNLKGKIIFIPYTKDIQSFYKRASVQLVTSSFESFGLVIAESKLYGIPLVIYELPVVELLKDGKGYVCIERHNIQNAADAILKIINNKKYAEQLSTEARDSIKPFLNFDHVYEWSLILSNSYKINAKVIEKDAKNMRLFWQNVLTMYNEGFSSRPSTKQQFKYIIRQLKSFIKTILKFILPAGSKRRRIAFKVYRAIKPNHNYSV